MSAARACPTRRSGGGVAACLAVLAYSAGDPRRAAVGDRLERFVDDGHGEVDLVLGDRERRRHAQAAGLAAGAAPHEVDGEPAALALVGERQAEGVGRLARVAVLDELKPAQQTETAHVADVLVTLLELAEASQQVLAARARPAGQPLLLDDVDDRQRRGG